jgi:putative ABC transport system permease protein
MNELFGIQMTYIMVALLAVFALSVISVAFVFFSNRVMFRMGIRNLPRRGTQTGLIVVGLMLSTLITTAAFTTGDTVDYSISSAAYDALQRTDLVLNASAQESKHGPGSSGDAPQIYYNESAVPVLEQQFNGDPDIDGFLPLLMEPVSMVDRNSNLAEPSVLLTGVDPQRQARLGGLRLTRGGRYDLTTLGEGDVLLNKKTADNLRAQIGDTITIFASGHTHDVQVAGIVESELASGALADGLGGGAAMRLDSVQALTGRAGQVNLIGVALKGGVRGSLSVADGAAARMTPYVNSSAGRAALGVGDRTVRVETFKKDAVASAEQNGNLFTTFFLVLGLFSIAAGVMLIFMIFVMIAAERKPEMGMARAVGAQRTNLVQSFLSEGMAYSVLAGAIGAALGVGASIALVLGILKSGLGSEADFVQAHVTVRSLIVSYCLGVVVTFITVVISSIKVSSINIVAAIRGTDDEGVRRKRASVSWKWVVIGIPSMIVPPLGIWFLFRKGFGVAWTWILAPAGLALAALSVFGARNGGSGSEFLFGFGFSLVPLCLAAVATHYRAPARATWTVVGLWLSAYWLSPWPIGEQILGTKLDGDIEMFLLSGIMVVIALTLIIVFNARLLTTFFQHRQHARYRVTVIASAAAIACVAVALVIGNKGDGMGQLVYLGAGLSAAVAAVGFAAARFPRFAPALKMAVAYPLASRFRTGMTIAMFSLIVFSLTVFSAINANYVSSLVGKTGDGGWNVMATANRTSPVDDLPIALRDAGSPVIGQIEESGQVTVYSGDQVVMQPGHDKEFVSYPVIAGDTAFFSNPASALSARANGYASDAEVFAAVREQSGLALLDGADETQDFDWHPVTNVTDHRFSPFKVQLRNPATGATATVTVIGIMSMKLSQHTIAGVYVNSADYTSVFDAPRFERTYLRLDKGVNANTAAKQIQSALSDKGVKADSIRKLIDDSVAENNAFMRMFQAFMALGLFVGIASLGVVAFRSVVERRQQIGMLRAIGYQSSTVALTFVLESSFIALMGIISGVVGGVILSRNLMTSGQFADLGAQFTVPWLEVAAFSSVAFAFSLLMTWIPSRGAAAVPVADALRYE